MTTPPIPGPEHRWYVSRDGKTRHGPYPALHLVAWARSGDLLPGDMLLLVGGAHWVRADAVPWLFPPPELPPDTTALIRYSCPACGKKIKSHSSAAGMKVLCPRCGQKVRVPIPPAPTNLTRLGILDAETPEREEDVPSAEERLARQDDDDDDLHPRPRRGRFRCLYCGSEERPLTREKVSIGGWIVFAVLLLSICTIPLCWLALFIRDTEVICYDCGTPLR